MKTVLLVFTVFFAGNVYAQPATKYLLKVAKLYDSEKNIFIANQEILVEGKLITKVGTGIKVPANTSVINLQSCTVSPGLIDAHTHILTIQKTADALETDLLLNSDIERSLRAVKIAKEYLHSGFTTIRDLGNSGMFLDLNMKRAINKGWVIGPRMVVSGPILSPEDGQFFNLSSQNRAVIDREYRVIKNVEDARQAVKDHISKGADVIKVVMGDGRITLTTEEVRSIVQTAHYYGMKVTAHATYDEVIIKALDAGVDGIEHGYNISDSLLDRMASQRVYLVPTIGTVAGYTDILDDGKVKSAEEVKGLQDFVNKSEAIVKKAIDKGVMVVNGADMYIQVKGSQGDAAKNSMEAYYEGCGKAGEVLKTATRNAAIACGVDWFTGVIKEKMTADIIAFDGDIEKDFKNVLYKIKFVMKDGEVLLHKQ